jgi:hypothetical protein
MAIESTFHHRHPRERGDPDFQRVSLLKVWVSAFAGMTAILDQSNMIELSLASPLAVTAPDDSVSPQTESGHGVTPQEFIGKWRDVELKERSASQSHFNDLCRLLGVLDPIGILD